MSRRIAHTVETLVLFRRSLLYQTREFFNNSTLHGVRYIAESGRPFGEKFMWFCFTATGAVAALVIIMSLWEKFQTNPTITGLDTDFHNQQIIFPTTVVCPSNAYDILQVVDVAYKELGQYEEEEAKPFEPFLKILTQLTFENMQEAYDLSLNFSASALGQKTLRSLAFQVKITCEDTLDYCKYRDEEVKCCPHFDPVYTEHGLCYAFNSKFKSREDADEPALEFHDLFETDKKWALYFLPKNKSKIYVHSHKEYFGWDYGSQLTWDSNQAAELLISMKQTYTTADAKQLSIGQRKCIFPDEMKLDYFSDEYTFSGCMKECRMKKCAKLCKCIPPFFKPLRNTPYCKVEQLGCLAKYKDNITNIKDCYQCELSCSKTVYDIEKLNKNSEKNDKYFVNIEYLTWPIIRYKREVLFGWVDLLVSFGGIAGLFLGFSLLSGVEIIYYFTMRACCMVYKNRDELYAIEEEIRKKPIHRYDMTLREKRGHALRRRRSSSVPSKPLPDSKTSSERDINKEIDDKFNPKKVKAPNIRLNRMGLIKSRGINNFARIGFKQVKPAPKSYEHKFRSKSSEPFEFFYLP